MFLLNATATTVRPGTARRGHDNGTVLVSFPSFLNGLRMHKLVSSVAVAAALATLSSAVVAQNVAVVNGRAVPMGRVEAFVSQVEKSGRPVTDEMRKQIKDEVVAREVFMQEAQRQGLDASADFKSQIELARQSILIRELFTQYQKSHPLADADIKAEYDKFVAANSGKEYQAHHILVEKEDQAKALIAQLKKGAKFEDLAKKNSKDPGSGARGGDLGWAPAANYVPEFSKAMVALSKGQSSDAPVKSQFGFHIIRLDDVREAQLPKLEDVKPQIAQQLQQQKLVRYQNELRSKAKVE